MVHVMGFHMRNVLYVYISIYKSVPSQECVECQICVVVLLMVLLLLSLLLLLLLFEHGGAFG